jgi:hypothetical protein
VALYVRHDIMQRDQCEEQPHRPHHEAQDAPAYRLEDLPETARPHTTIVT